MTWARARKLTQSLTEYAQALAFDQLRKIMETGRAFVGFREGRITFPPTFKYDVRRSVRRRRSSSKPLGSPFTPSTPVPGHQKLLTQVTEKESEGYGPQVTEDNAMGEPDEDDEEEGEKGRGQDAASVVSSTFTSARSKYTNQSQVEESQDGDDEDLIFSATTTKTKTGKVIQRLSLTAVKAKAKWVSMVSPAKADLKYHIPSIRRNM